MFERRRFQTLICICLRVFVSFHFNRLRFKIDPLSPSMMKLTRRGVTQTWLSRCLHLCPKHRLLSPSPRGNPARFDVSRTLWYETSHVIISVCMCVVMCGSRWVGVAGWTRNWWFPLSYDLHPYCVTTPSVRFWLCSDAKHWQIQRSFEQNASTSFCGHAVMLQAY